MYKYQIEALRYFRKVIMKESQGEIATRIGIQQKRWSTYETGKTEIPPELILLLKHHGFKEEWLDNGVSSEDVKEAMIMISKTEYEKLKKAAAKNKNKIENIEQPKIPCPAIKEEKQGKRTGK